MVTYGSTAATILVNRAADAALVWAVVPSIEAASFAAKPKHRTMPTASTGVAMSMRARRGCCEVIRKGCPIAPSVGLWGCTATAKSFVFDTQ